MLSRRAMAAMIAASPAFGIVDEWPQWRGPARDGAAPAAPDPAQWPEKLKQVWKTKVGEGHSSPVLGDGRVYEFARTGDREIAAAYDPASGKKLWEHGYSAPYEMNPAASGHGKGPKSTPLLSKGKLYTFGMSGVLSCLDASTGKLVWSYNSPGYKMTSPTFGVAMSPIVSSNDVIAHVGTDRNGALTAFDANTGKIRWQWKGEGPAYSSPVLVKTGAITQIVTFSAEKFFGVNAADGSLQWELPFTTPYSQNAVTPFAIGDMVVYSGLSAPVTAVRIQSGRPPQKLWENREVGLYMSSPVLAAGLLHGLSHRNKGQYFSLDPKTGKTVWTSDGRQGENAMLISRGQTVFALNTDSDLQIFHADGKGLSPIRKYSVATSPTWAHPAILGNRFYIKDLDSLALWTA